MKDRYRIIISGKKIYKEIEVSPEDTLIRFGTESGCDVRIRKDLFYYSFALVFSKDEKNVWNIVCPESMYISVDEVRKLVTLPLYHGLELILRHQDSASEAFRVAFLIDFNYEEKDYGRHFDISAVNTVTIGNQMNCNIVIRGTYIQGDQVVLQRSHNALVLRVLSTKYGVYHNGRIVNGQAVIYDGDFFSIANISFCYRVNYLYTQESDEIQGNGINYSDSTQRGSYPKFRRNSRIKWVMDDTKIEILDPPPIPKKPKNNILTRLLPSLFMVAASLIMGMAGGAFIIISLVSAGGGIVTALLSVKDANKEYKKELSDRISKYNTYIAKKRDEITQARDAEISELQNIYIAERQEVSNLKTFSSDLFDRRPGDEDFLEVRLGMGRLEAKRAVEYKKQERLEIEDELQMRPEQLAEEYKCLDHAPIVCDFKNANAVGISGTEGSRYSIFKNILLDVCARQYHSDVSMFFVAESRHAGLVRSLRILPQVYNPVLGIYNVVSDDSSRTVIFEYLYQELTKREQNKIKAPHMLVFLYDECGFKTHPVSRFVDCAKELGVTFVFFGETRADIGQGCRYLIHMKNDRSGILIDTEDGRKKREFALESISDSDIGGMIQLLAPVYTEEVSLEGSLTKSVSLFELLRIFSTEDLDLAKYWTSSKVHQSMAAPIGVSKSGVVWLDLHDKAHGPHGLVAGTTGAGKSELLQTYIMSMAILYHPYEVGFVIIDFKGGGMANQFADLPHMVGTITNIDGKEIDRSLRSIKAELQKRQRLFKEAGVNHIDKYIIEYRRKNVTTPLPHLILIVDEFAELKADQPEFMKELISAARIGRSLGVHLILATQKPSGQVDEQIWSNSRFKLCLKVQSQQDSNEVLKSPLAAEIKEPGRAYLQVGNNEIFELFQSAYSGAPEHTDDSNTKEFAIYEITASGKRIPVYRQKKKQGKENDKTQLDALMHYIRRFCEVNKLRKLPNICLPPLSTVVDFPQREYQSFIENHIVADLGIYDDPDNQLQSMYSIDFSGQNLMIIGSSQSGKTNVLQAVIRSLAEKYTPNEVSIYIIDFASMVLKNFERLNHVGGVVTASDDEKLKNLFKLLYTEIKTRKEKLLSVGVSSYSAYREAGQTDLPQIILMIDNLTALRELYFQDDDELLELCREGSSVGITVIIANSQTAGIGYKYLSNFAGRIAMFNNDSAEYNSLFDHCSQHISDVPGRAIVEVDKIHLECQMFLAFCGEKEIDRVQNITAFVDRINQIHPNAAALNIPVIPNVLLESETFVQYRTHMTQHRLFAGLDFSTVSPLWFKLSQLGVMAISGRNGMGKHNFIRHMIRTIEKFYWENTKVYIVDSINRKLSDLKDSAVIDRYVVLADQSMELVMDIADTLKVRYESVANGDDSVLSSAPTIVLIINNRDAVEMISEDTKVLDAYLDIVGKYKNMNVCVIVSDFENTKVSYTSPEIFKKLRDAKHFLFFDDLGSMKIVDDLPISVIRENKKALETGEAYYIKENEVVKLKTPKANG